MIWRLQLHVVDRPPTSRSFMECTPSALHPSHLFCNICDTLSSSEIAHRSHLLGKKHWHNQRLRDEAMRSVYVKGLPLEPTVSQNEIEDVFGVYGAIHKIVLDQKGIYAIVEYASVESALQVLRCPNPVLMRGMALSIRPREFKPHGRKTKRNDTSTEEAEVTRDDDSTHEVAEPSFVSLLRDKYRLIPEHMTAITTHDTLDQQIMSLTTQVLSSPDVQRSSIDLLCRLQSHFATVFPRCQIVPFGSMATGLATPTSDMDIALLIDWNEEDDKYIGSDLLPTELKRNSSSHGNHVEDMETSSGSLAPPQTPPMSESLTPFSLPHNVKCAGGGRDMKACPHGYREAVGVVSRVEGFNRILAIPTARCPIIRFTDTISGITCDISINNRCGLYNTKLLKAYLSFDDRVLPLMTLVKIWIQSLSGIRISNYALMIMVIHCLQRATPPLLPCLQRCDPWPRNMAWFVEKGFASSGVGEQVEMGVDGWSFNFLHHQSLMPSQNKSTIGELFHYFLSYYSAQFPFPTHTVSIHTPCSALLTNQEAVLMANQASPSCVPQKNSRPLRVTPLCVQDPIELSHNVAKNVSHSALETLKREMARSCVTMETLLRSVQSCDGGILHLLGNETTPSSGYSIAKTPKGQQTLYFAVSNICNLLNKTPPTMGVSDIIALVDTSSQYAKEKLSIIIIKSLVHVLQNDLGFTCAEATITIATTNEARGVSLAITRPLQFPGTIPGPLGSSDNTQIVTKRSREDEDCHEDCDPPSVSREGGEVKRVKSFGTDAQSNAIALLERHCLTGDGGRLHPRSFLCTSFTNTWTHRRRFRRQNVAPPTGLAATPTETPLLQFTMTTAPNSNDDVILTVEFNVTENFGFMNEFLTFFAFFKKVVLF